MRVFKDLPLDDECFEDDCKWSYEGRWVKKGCVGWWWSWIGCTGRGDESLEGYEEFTDLAEV